MTASLGEITIRHIHTQETRTFPIIRAVVRCYRDQLNYSLEILWPLCGVYTVDLIRGHLREVNEWQIDDTHQAWKTWQEITKRPIPQNLGKQFAIK